jgi:D-3-phosphoglycerate dehydrogenase
MERVCLIVQPIHPEGERLLREAGLVPRLASASDMVTVAREIVDATAVITRSAGLDPQAMDAARHLRVIGSHGVGVNAVAVDHATALGIPVVNTPEANRVAVAEHTVALMLAAAKNLVAAHEAGRQGDFDFKYRTALTEISGKVLGIVGFGGIGRKVAAIAKAGFGMQVLVLSQSADPGELRQLGYQLAADLDSLLRDSDFVSLHRPLMSTAGFLIGERELALMKPGSILINTARGALVDESALVAALTAKRIAGAALDVFQSEQMKPGHPLLAAPNAILTPHVAGSAEEALKRTAEQVVERVVSVLAGTPMDVVNPDVWERRRR